MSLITVKDAAERAGVSTKAIYYSVKEGKLKAQRQYGRVLIDDDELKTYKPRKGSSASAGVSSETHTLAAEGLRHIWDTPEEDAAWAYLQEEI